MTTSKMPTVTKCIKDPSPKKLWNSDLLLRFNLLNCCLFIYLFIYLFVYLFIYLFIYAKTLTILQKAPS